MNPAPTARPVQRGPAVLLLLVVFGPLLGLFAFSGPIPQDPGYHVFADVRTCLGVPNFGNVASNALFLAVGAIGAAWCARRAGLSARLSWFVFFLGVALVFFGSGYYHRAPSDESLVWDRLPMTVAFMALLSALVTEHMPGVAERALLAAALAAGIASVIVWSLTGDLRLFIWVQAVPLLAIPFVVVAYPGRHTHRRYLFYGVGFYALAKLAEWLDEPIFDATGAAISGHSLKHLLAGLAPLCVYLMLRRRETRPT